MDVCSDGQAVWIVNNGDDTVSKKRSSDGTDLGTFPTGKSPRGCLYDGQYIWIANSGDDTVSKLAAVDGSLAGTFPVGKTPMAIAFDELGQFYVVNQGDNTVTMLEWKGNSIGVLAVGRQPSAVVYTAWGVVVANTEDDTISVILGGHVARTVTLNGHAPMGMMFDDVNLWIAMENSSMVLMVPPSMLMIETFPTGGKPVAVARDDVYVYIVNSADGSITRINPNPDSPSSVTIAVGKSPAGIVFDSAHMWVVNSADDTASKR